MKFSKDPLSQIITQLCLAKGIDHIVLSPGSRNAPLIIGFTEHSDFNNFSIVDERCAGFFALGLAQQLKKPVAIVCTSGSALLNYYPAIAEAFYSNIPLVVISADRPEALINIGDGQTIMQENAFGNHIIFNANCKEGTNNIETNIKMINTALNNSLEFQGPVHINIPFTEPLYETISTLEIKPKNIPINETNSFLNKIKDISQYQKQWNSASKKMVLIGVLHPKSLAQHIVDQLAEDDCVIILTETTSNVHHHSIFPSIDQLIAPLGTGGFKELQPDILLTIGGMIVSKKVKAFLRNYAPKIHWHVDPLKGYDTYFCLKYHFKLSPNNFFEQLLQKKVVNKSNYQKDWLKIREYRLERHSLYEATILFSDFKVFSEISKILPNEIQLQLSNSATIRYAQLFNFDKRIEVFCNRGTSGIEGCTSTAIGAAFVSDSPTVFITGDLGFLYDSNALWNNYIPSNFKIIVINNGGGGIFRILSGEKDSKNFDTYFETKHHLTAKHLCAMFNFNYSSIHKEENLQSSLTSFFQISEGPCLLEVFTPSGVNDKVLLDYFSYLK